jgi:PKD repeat protein
MAWLGSYPYRKEITTTNPSEWPLTWVITVTVAYEAGKMRTDFQDVDFTDQSGDQTIPFYRQTVVEGVSAVFRVYIGLVGPGGTNTSYMYYGTLVALDDDPEGTFLFYDNHGDNSVDPTKWVVSSGVTEENNEYMKIDNPTSLQTRTAYSSPWPVFDVGKEMVVKFKLGTRNFSNYNESSFGMNSVNFGPRTADHAIVITMVEGTWKYIVRTTGFAAYQNLPGSYSLNTYYTFRIKWQSDSVKIYNEITGDLLVEITDTQYIPTENMYVQYRNADWVFARIFADYVDYVWVRNIPTESTSPDPTTTEGDEEIPLVADFTWYPVTPRKNQEVSFYDASIGSAPDSWIWDFGDGGSSTIQNPKHTFTTSGPHTITLTASVGGSSDDVSKTITISATDNTNCIDLETFRYEIKNEADVLEKSEKFPDDIMNEWIQLDIIATVKEFIKSLHWKYIHKGIVHLQSNAGYSQTDVNHAAASTEVTGFSGLTVNEYSNGAILYSDGTNFYLTKISSNTATVITLDVGTSLPAIINGTIFLTKPESTGLYANITGIDCLDVTDPVIVIKNLNGDIIRKIDLDKINEIGSIDSYDNTVFWYQNQNKIFIAYGSSGKVSNALEIIFLRKPRKSSTDDQCIDLPIEYHSYAQHLTMGRIYSKIGNGKLMKINQDYLKLSRRLLHTNEEEILSNTRKLLGL